MEIGEGWDAALRHYRLILILTILTAIVALGVAFASSPKYHGTASVLVRAGETRMFRTGGQNINPSDVVAVRTIGDTEVAMFKTRAIAEKVVQQLQLDQRKPPEGIFSQIKGMARKYWAMAIAIIKYGEYKEATPYEAAVAQVNNGISVKLYKDSYMMVVDAVASEPELAAAIANTAADAFVEYTREVYGGEATRYREFVEKEFRQAEADLRESQAALRNYKQQQGISSLDEEVKLSLASIENARQLLKETDAQIDQSKAKIELARQQIEELNPTIRKSTTTTNETTTSTPSTVTTTSTSDSTTKSTSAGDSSTKSTSDTKTNTDGKATNISGNGKDKDQKNTTSNSASTRGSTDKTDQSSSTSKNESTASSTGTTVVTTEGETTSSSSSRSDTIEPNPIYQSVKSDLLNLERDLEALQARRDSLAAAIADQRSLAASVPEREAQLSKLSLEATAATNQYVKLKMEYEDALLSEARGIDEARVIDRATAPLYPNQPLKVLYLAVGLLVGFVGGILLVLVIEGRRRPRDGDGNGKEPFTSGSSEDITIKA